MVSGNGANGVTVQQQDPAWSLLDDVLRERSAEYRARVYELVARYKWDVDDPNFLILMATGQMEVLLEKFPEQFEEMFVELLGRLQQEGGELREWFAQERGDLAELIRALEVLQAQETEVIRGEVKRFQGVVDEARQWTQEQSQEALRFAEEEHKRVEKRLHEAMEGAQKEFLTASQKHASVLANRMFDRWALRMRTESFTWGATIGGMLFGVGLILGVILHIRYVEVFTDTNLANRLWGWNQERYFKCQIAKKKTCEFNIVRPGE